MSAGEAIAEPTLRPRSGSELQAVMNAERGGEPFLLWRDEDGAQRILTLEPKLERVTIGRRPANEVALEWDRQVSRTHALLQLIGGEWTVSDDGISANGTLINGERISGQRRLRDGDLLHTGTTPIAFRDPAAAGGTTLVPGATLPAPELSRLQTAVLEALARPYLDGESLALPASNRRIAEEVHLSVDAVKSHLGKLFVKFGIAELPQNEKRTRLVECGFRAGILVGRRPAR